MEVIDGKEMVNYIWCKVCAKHKQLIYSNPSCKGRARAGVDKYIIGTNFVSKWTIERLIEKGIYLSLNKHVCADDS